MRTTAIPFDFAEIGINFELKAQTRYVWGAFGDSKLYFDIDFSITINKIVDIRQCLCAFKLILAKEIKYIFSNTIHINTFQIEVRAFILPDSQLFICFPSFIVIGYSAPEIKFNFIFY